MGSSFRRGLVPLEDRNHCRALIEEAVSSGARKRLACEFLGLSLRRLERWEKTKVDQRSFVKKDPPNRLSKSEVNNLLRVVNTIEYRDLSPKQIVPRLADKGVYLASESTIYRLLSAQGMLAHRGRTKRGGRKKPDELVAIKPNQIFSWDITYLKASVKGSFYYLYLILDIYSRKIVGYRVHDHESAELAALLIDETALKEKIDKGQLVLHSDNGGPMKGATMLSTLQQLGVVPSFSRPRVSDDNPYSESMFKTLKYRPSFPDGRFASIDEATEWVDLFVKWYNEEHLHSGINFVTPSSRHEGCDGEILEKRKDVYELAKEKNPERWPTKTRSWEKVESVYLNPNLKKEKNKKSLDEAT